MPPTLSADAVGRNFIPREHGATAMLLTPFLSAAILLRQVRWPEVVALIAIACAFAIKDPLVVIARQRLVWKQEHAETKAAQQWAAIELVLLGACGIVLMLTGDWQSLAILFVGAAAFTVLAVTINVRNRQRSEWFQVASAVALTATSLAACLSVQSRIPGWCWLLWLLCSLQAAAGIFVVHSRLDARIAARKGGVGSMGSRRAAFLSQAALVIAAALFAFVGRFWLATALLIAAACYLLELRRQEDAASLQMPLKRVGQQALALSSLYALLIVIGLW
jgi:hypothetical protein